MAVYRDNMRNNETVIMGRKTVRGRTSTLTRPGGNKSRHPSAVIREVASRPVASEVTVVCKRLWNTLDRIRQS